MVGAAVNMMFSDLHESSAKVLIGDLMGLSAGVPGIEYHERPEYADRIALLRGQGRLLINFVGTFTTSLGLLTQIVVTIALLGSVHPALLLLPVLAAPSVWAGGRANRIAEEAKEATAEQVRARSTSSPCSPRPGRPRRPGCSVCPASWSAATAACGPT